MSLPHRYRHEQRHRDHHHVPGPPDSAGPAPARTRPRLDWRLRFAALSLIWGFSFLLIKVGTQGYAPFQVTLGRLAFGTAVLAVAMAVRRERLPRGCVPGGIWRSPGSC